MHGWVKDELPHFSKCSAISESCSYAQCHAHSSASIKSRNLQWVECTFYWFSETVFDCDHDMVAVHYPFTFTHFRGSVVRWKTDFSHLQ